MKGLGLYAITSFLLLPIGALFALTALLALLISFTQIQLLLNVFIVASIAIYIFTNFWFYHKCVSGNQTCPKKLADWIKVNAYVTIVFALLSLPQFIISLFKPQLLHQIVNMVTEQNKNLPVASSEFYLSLVYKIIYVFIFLLVFLLINIFMSFKALKFYKEKLV